MADGLALEFGVVLQKHAEVRAARLSRCAGARIDRRRQHRLDRGGQGEGAELVETQRQRGARLRQLDMGDTFFRHEEGHAAGDTLVVQAKDFAGERFSLRSGRQVACVRRAGPQEALDFVGCHRQKLQTR